MTNTDRLQREITAARNALLNSIRARREHPTFGYTKARIRSEYDHLVGLVEAWTYVTEVWDNPGRVLWSPDFNDYVARVLGVDLSALRTAAEAA